MLFDVGNLVTIGITILLIVFFRLLDKSNRSLDRVRKYVDRCKDDISAYIEDRSSIIKDYAIALDVEKKAAAELMRRIQKITREELEQKVQVLTQIDERIQGYDTSLAELIRMHGMVQDNMSWIREESGFVQGVAKQLGEVKEKTESAEAGIGSIGRRLESMEARFEEANAEALGKATETVMAGARAAILDLESRLEREEKRLEALFAEAVEQAGRRADKVEEAALAKLIAQAEERLHLVKTSFEDKLKSFQDFAKANRDEMQDLMKLGREEWEAETAAINAQKEAYGANAQHFKDEWDRHAWELGELIKRQSEEIGAALREQDGELRGELGRHREGWEAMHGAAGQDVAASVKEKLERVKAGFDEKVKSFQELVKASREDMQEQLKRNKEEWKAEMASVNAQRKEFGAEAKKFREEWDKRAEELRLFMRQQADEVGASLAGQDGELRGALEAHREEWKALYRDAGLDIVASVDGRLEGYRQAQEELIGQLAGIAEDGGRLEEELRVSMKDTADRVAGDFSQLGQEMREAWEGSSLEFAESIRGLRAELSDLQQGLSRTRETAFESISGKLKKFEDEFLEDLSNRSVGIDLQLNTWQEALDSRLEATASEIERKRKKAESKATDEMKGDFAALRDKLTADLESLKARADSFEERAAREMRDADESRRLLGEQLERNLSEAKSAMEEVRRESAAMSKAIERSGSLRKELNLHDEKLKGDVERLARLEADVAKFEAQVDAVKRMEDDVHAGMNRFMAEKRRIDGMENDFSRLLRTAQSVEGRLAQVSNSDDVLQTVQVKIRQLDDVIKDAEEKFQRVERKSQTMQETTDGIDRNFRSLQESEHLAKRLDDTVAMLRGDVDAVQKSVAALSAGNEKTLEAAEKLATLDESIQWLEGRIGEMNKARESAARLATEIQDLGREAQNLLKLTRGLLKQPAERSGKGFEDGAPPARDRETVLKLLGQGWTVDEVARSMKMSKGEVELIRELG